MFFSVTKVLAVAGVLTGTVYACCSSGCYCVKADAHAAADCSDAALGGQTAFANYGDHSICVSLDGATAVTGNNDGCGNSNCNIHWYSSADTCNADPTGGAGDFPFTRANGGSCVAKPDGANFMRTVCS